MINSSPPERSGWNNRFFLLILLFPLLAQSQEPQCTGRYKERIVQSSLLISAGHYRLASALLRQLEPEVTRDCPADSAALSDIAYLTGNLSLLLDDPYEALNHYREARAWATGLLQLSRIDQNTGSAFFMLGDYERATRYFSHALSELEYSEAFNPSGMISLYDNLGAAGYENGDLKDAGKWWELATAVAETGFSADSVMLAGLMHNSGLVAFAKNDWSSATRYFLEAMQFNPGRNQPIDRMNVMIRKSLSMSLIKEGRISEAEESLALFRADDPVFCRSEPVLCAEILRMKAWIRFSSGMSSEAVTLLSEAADLINYPPIADSSITYHIEKFRLQRDKAAMLFLGSPDIATANIDDLKVIFAEQMIAFSLLQTFRNADGSYPDFILLHDSIDILLYRTVETGYRFIPSQPGIACDLLKCTESNSGRRFRADAFALNSEENTLPNSLTNEWLRLNRQLYLHTKREVESLGTYTSSNPDQKNRKFHIENELDSLTQLLRVRYPGNSLVADSGEEGISALMSRLSDGEAILEYLSTPGQVYSFIVRNDGVTLVRSKTEPSFLTSVTGLMAALRTADDPSFRENVPSVSGVLIDPVLPYLDDIRRLYIIPGRELESLPFECLEMGGERYLPERFAITYHLSLSEVTPDQCLKLKTETAGISVPTDFLAFSPAFSENRCLQKTGNTVDEVNEIGMMFTDANYISKVFTEEEADETTFLREARNGSIVHIATHAKVDLRIPERSGLHLWKQTPAISGDELIDGILEMGEVKGMRFRCRLLTLSSCTFGLRDPQARKSKINLPGDFLDAGAQRVLYSLWNVSDRHTRTLMTDFYRFWLEGDDFPEALRKAKVKMLNNPATASPYFWSAFILGSK